MSLCCFKLSRQTNMIKITRLLFILLLLLFFVGCAVKPPDFVYVTPDKNDTFSSLAKEHLGDPSKAWRIKDSNDIATITPGEELIIPTSPVRPGGLKATGYQVVPVLSYHNFTSGKNQDMLTVSGKSFEKQLGYLKKEKYHTLTIDQFEEFIKLGGDAPENSVMITIDDGWKSSYNIAFPILQKFGFSAILFVTTDYINEENGKIITWEQAREMNKDHVIDIQCHSRSHRDFNLLNEKESMPSFLASLADEIATSKDIINKKIGTNVTSFAYAYGNTNPIAIEMLKQNDFKTAFTVKRRKNSFFTPEYSLHRQMIFGDHDMNYFKKSVSVFKKFKIDKIEPIDQLKDIRKLDYQNASEYEKKEQWRSALVAWKMQRDWLKSHKVEMAKASLASKEDLLKKAKEKVEALNQKVKQIAQSHYLQATRSRGNRTIRKHLLRTLLYDPEHQAAFRMLKNMPVKKQLAQYTVRENDTFTSISKKIYNNTSNDVLIPLFNGNIKTESDLKPGMELTLPSSTAMSMIKTSISSRCDIKLDKPSYQMAQDLYSEANVLFSQDKIEAAIDKLKKATCLNPSDEIAKEMLEMLQGL